MNDQQPIQVFLSYGSENQDSVESLARRLHGDTRLPFWFGPWHSVPGVPIQEQMEEALVQAHACAVFISGGAGGIVGWQHEQLRVAIQTRIEDDANYPKVRPLGAAVVNNMMDIRKLLTDPAI